MARSLYVSAMEKIFRHTHGEMPDGEVGEILRVAMRNNITQEVNYRQEDVGNQLHYCTDTPKGILAKLDSEETILDIGMEIPSF